MNPQGTNIFAKDFKEPRKDLEHQKEKMTSKSVTSEWFTKIFVCRHLVESRVHHNVPKEESFPESMNNIDVTRTTHTNLDVLQKQRIKHSLSVDGERTLSDSWTRFTKFTFLNKKYPPGKMWSEGRLTKILATIKPNWLWPEIGIDLLKIVNRQE